VQPSTPSGKPATGTVQHPETDATPASTVKTSEARSENSTTWKPINRLPPGTSPTSRPPSDSSPRVEPHLDASPTSKPSLDSSPTKKPPLDPSPSGKPPLDSSPSSKPRPDATPIKKPPLDPPPGEGASVVQDAFVAAPAPRHEEPGTASGSADNRSHGLRNNGRDLWAPSIPFLRFIHGHAPQQNDAHLGLIREQRTWWGKSAIMTPASCTMCCKTPHDTDRYIAAQCGYDGALKATWQADVTLKGFSKEETVAGIAFWEALREYSSMSPTGRRRSGVSSGC